MIGGPIRPVRSDVDSISCERPALIVEIWGSDAEIDCNGNSRVRRGVLGLGVAAIGLYSDLAL